MAIQLQGTNAANVLADAGSSALRSVLYDSAGNPLVVAPASAIGSTQKIIPVGGASEGNWDGLRLDRMGNLRPGNDTIILRDPCEGTTINTQVWAASVGTYTQAQVATTGINFNSGNGLASGSYSILTSNKQIPLLAQSPIRVRLKARVVPQANALAELGFAAPSGVVGQLTNGAVWRYTSGGTVVPVLVYNGADVVQGTDVSGLLNAANYYTFEIVVTDQQATFNIYSTGLLIASQTLNVPVTQPFTWGVTHLPVAVRLYTTGATSSAAYVYLRDVLVQGFDLAGNEPWTHQLAGTGLGGEVNPTTFGQTANFANSAAASNATLSNTAAGYATLGGLYSFVAVGSAATDFALFSMAIPAPYSHFLTGLHITALNTGAIVAATPTVMQWGAYVNSPGVSLASGAPLMRVAVGQQSFPVGAVIGATANDLDVVFDVPLRTDAGRFAGVILRMPVATATASQVIQGSVLMKGYFE